MLFLKEFVFHWSAIIEGVFLHHDWVYGFPNYGQSFSKEDVEYYRHYIRVASNCRLAFSLCILLINNRNCFLEYRHVLVTHCVLRLIALMTILRAEYRFHFWIVPFPMLIAAGMELLHLLYLYVIENDMLNWKQWKMPVFRNGEEKLDEVTLMACEKLADGWRKIENGEMTEEELEEQKKELKAFLFKKRQQ